VIVEWIGFARVKCDQVDVGDDPGVTWCQDKVYP